jgi:hypothetical protein
MVELFSLLEDGVAILRVKSGVYKQTKVYRRGQHIYVQASGGFVRVVPHRLGESFGTSHPDIKVLDLEAPGVLVTAKGITLHG